MASMNTFVSKGGILDSFLPCFIVTATMGSRLGFNGTVLEARCWVVKYMAVWGSELRSPQCYSELLCHIFFSIMTLNNCND